MLTKRQNMLECIKGGNPDRFVKQYEAINLVMGTPVKSERPQYMKGYAVDAWGVTWNWPEGVVSAFPVHDEEHIVVKDIEHWQDYVKAPNLKFSDAEWEPFIAKIEAVDRNEQFALPFYAGGLFEMTHHLCEIQNALCYFYENPDELHELIKYLTEYELQMAEALCHYMKPDGIFHHDDWGTKMSTFMRPDMFEEFYLDSYKQIYGYYKTHGAELIVHHCDTYAATLVPYMIEMGIDVWQGCLVTNDVPELVKKYGGQISFMGGIASELDVEDFDPAEIEKEVVEMCEQTGPRFFIPCNTRGLPGSLFKGVYDSINDAIDVATEKLLK